MKDQAPTSKHQRNSKQQIPTQRHRVGLTGARHSCRFDAQSAGDLEILSVLASRTVKRAEARAPELNGATLALTPALSPRRDLPATTLRALAPRTRSASSPGLRPSSLPFGMEERNGERRCSGSWAGRIVRRLSRIPAAGLARWPFAKLKAPNSCPLSPGERAGVRASVSPSYIPTKKPSRHDSSTWRLMLGVSLDVGAWGLELSPA